MSNTEYIPIAGLNQYAYCLHRCWRMFCAGEFTDNQYTIEGTSLHSRVHTLGEGHREESWQVRAIWLKSERYQLIGKADLIEESDVSLTLTVNTSVTSLSMATIAARLALALPLGRSLLTLVLY
jgi:CRISPR/Cas system-associated exonuclease Cas4 (RecB family)